MDNTSALAFIQHLISALRQVEQPVVAQDTAPDDNHFVQIQDLTPDDRACDDWANTPNEQYAEIDSVTDHAGGGINGPKHAADLRTDSPSLYHYLIQMEHERGKY